MDVLAALLSALEAERDPPTTVRDFEGAVDTHIADSLSGLVCPVLRSAVRIADVGSGAGFPGLALAAALPAASVDLIEATARKGEVAARLGSAAGVTNARAVSERVEDWAGGEGRNSYDAVTARAVAPLAVLLEYAAPLLRIGGALVAYKGSRDPAEESNASVAAGELAMRFEQVIPVRPFPKARDRHLHVWTKVAATPSRFPRRAGMARKRPLGDRPHP